jgi:hypothetical protein
MFKKDLTQKEILEVLVSIFFFFMLLICFFMFLYGLIYPGLLNLGESNDPLFIKIIGTIFGLFLVLIMLFSTYVVFINAYHSIGNILEKKKDNTFRNLKIASFSIFLLIWFTSAQGIFNRIILGPHDNQAMAELLYKKSRKTKEYRIGAICSDGWESSATGRGACSWHGGVEEWLYETETYYSKSFKECKDEAEQMSLLDYYVW